MALPPRYSNLAEKIGSNPIQCGFESHSGHAMSVLSPTMTGMPHIRSDETVASALLASDNSMPDAENAAVHGVAVKTIRRWRRLYQRRGLPRGQAHTRVPCPRCEDGELDAAAYSELFGWYLGDGHITSSDEGSTPCMSSTTPSTQSTTRGLLT